MRVLHVIPSIAPCRGGPSAAVAPMISALREADVDSALLTTNDNGPANSDIPLGDWFEYQDVPVLAFPRNLKGMRWYDEHIVAPGALDWLRENGAQWDLVHVHAVFSYLSSQAMRWARLASRPYLCRPLGQLCLWSLGQKSTRKRVYLRLLEKANLEAADRVHFTSRQEQLECQQAGLSVRGLVVPHGINLPVVRSPETDHKCVEPKASNDAEAMKSILFLGRLDRKKGLERLLAAFSQVAASLPGAVLTVAGSGDASYVTNLRTRADELELGDRVRFVGWVQGAEKHALLESADLFVLPSYSENFGVAVLEALSYGLPVLVSEAVALAAEVDEAGAGLVVSGSEPSIADGLLKLGKDFGLRRRMSSAGRQLAGERFSWPGVARQLKTHYQQILAAA
ncbi:MAG: glycosyltransferase [Pseudomonadota bacterium]